VKSLIKKPVIIFWAICLIIAIFLLSTKGLQYGVDFSGGTAFSIVLEEPVPAEDISRVTSVISRRLDWAGLKDAKVNAAGNQYITAQLAESDPEKISKLRTNLLRQGKFEAILDGEVLFVGEEIRSIQKDPAKGYGTSVVDNSGAARWVLPFMLSPEAANRFAEMTFHKCNPIGYGTEIEYDCEKTYFFIDRPIDSIIIIDNETYFAEREVPSAPELLQSDFLKIEEILDQVRTKYYVVDSNLTTEQLTEITVDLNVYTKAIVSSNVANSIKEQLRDLGYKITIKEKSKETVPWVWEATGLKSVISLTDSVTNMDAPTLDSPRFQRFNNLTITGSGETQSQAKERLEEIVVILESGSLPIAIESISTETISPYLGDSFLKNSLLIGLFALLTVAIVLFFRYKLLSLTIPILIADLSEITLLLAALSLISYRLDLASVAGVLAIIGTAVDHKIIITDELIKGKKDETDSNESPIVKIKKAFFVIFASAATIMATMLPIILFSTGLSKLVGFAITIILGSLVGIFISRPAYAEFAKYAVTKAKKKKAK
jgi:preprotein translocase subunit SecD